MAPTLLLTRPEAQAREIAATLGVEVPVVIAPIMRIVAIGVAIDLSRYAGVILTSANAVSAGPGIAGTRIYCVGERTAETARDAGAEVVLVAKNADDLVARLKGAGPLVHLRGEHARGDVAKRLNSAGIETDEAVVYRQEALPVSDQVRALVAGGDPVVLPLYSPRSAKLLGEQLTGIGPKVHAIAMSDAVAEAWQVATGQAAEVCAEPTGAAMRARILAALSEESA
jgi:uroporphyrinogen-III synthase